MMKKILIIILVIICVLIIGGIIWMDRIISPPSGPSPFEPCDLNRDNKCDLTDYNIMEDSMNTCAGDEYFNSAPDLDGSGCVTTNDKKYLLSLLPEDFNIPVEDIVHED